jgi:hypothetical protein
MAAAMPDQRLIRRRGTPEVFVLNEHGYRRHVTNPSVFASYGWTASDIADVNDADFASYPEGNLIMRAGDTQVYSVSGTTKRPLGSIAALQANETDLNGLHLVNQTDLDSYATVSL